MMNNKIKNNTKIFVFLVLFFIVPIFAEASVVFSEIMYNPDGSDDGSEWIGVLNNGDESVDLAGWKLNENETNHKIESDDLLLEAGEFAIIADNVSKFSTNYPDYSGKIFDSAFSLSNKGEQLILKDKSLNEIDQVNYLPEWGADGDGNSLQLLNDDWIASSPTIGIENENSQNNSVESSGNIETQTQTEEDNSNYGIELEQKIFANAGSDKMAVSGADVSFSGLAFGLEKKPIENARFFWTFGDGSYGEGKSLLHTYQYPGKYVVVLNVSSGEYVGSDRLTVTVSQADIIISNIDVSKSSVELYNKSKYELNLSWWRVRSGNQFFTLPKDTILLPQSKITLPFEATNLSYQDVNQIYLLYPNGKIVCQYGGKVDVETVASVVSYPSSNQKTKAVSQTTTSKTKKSPTVSVTKESSQDFQPSSEDVTIDTEEEIQNNQTATVADAKISFGFLNKWFLGLCFLIFVSVGSLLFLRRVGEKTEEDLEALNPDDFKII